MLMATLDNRRTMRRQTLLVVITWRLAEVMIANAVEEDHQHRPCHEEEHGSRQGIDQHTNPEPRIACRQPRNRGFKRMLAEVFHAERAHEDDHAAKPGKERRANGNRMAQR